MASINTNAAANQARQALAASQKELATSRNRIATGKVVASAKDNGAINSIATMMSAERSGWTVANDSLARGQSLIATASAGLDAITDLLQKAREKAVAYRDTSLSAQAKASIRADIEALLRQVDRTAMLAEFDGKKPLADILTPTTVTQTSTTYTTVTSPYTPPAMSSLVGYTSGSGSRTFAVNGGAAPGRIDLDIDTYSALDVVEVWQGTRRVAATGQPYAPGGVAVAPGTPVTFQNVLSFDYDPANGQSLEFRFNEHFGGSGWQINNVVLTPTDPLPTPTTTTTTTSVLASVATNYEFVRSSSGDLEGVAARPMTLNALKLEAIDWNEPAQLFGSLDAALGQAVDAATYYGERASSFDRLIEQNGRLADALETGVGNLVDADLGKESAKLQAGQIKESLATKALAIANAAPQWILALFKG
ncbi:flagellin [Caulobacter sp. X]|uniref:flagellin N-terminal helical domain-containing protein n=1 Tax=Caulobacter sp. X TaxID=2048901 RepID=UPI000C15FE67|nr:flagellin [Caulobacter sp. X]